MKQLLGDLSIKNAVIGLPVKCIIQPDISRWQRQAERQFFTVPQVGMRYFVRANVLTATHSGIWLATEKRNGRLIALANPAIASLGEPFFAYHCFMLTNRP